MVAAVSAQYSQNLRIEEWQECGLWPLGFIFSCRNASKSNFRKKRRVSWCERVFTLNSLKNFPGNCFAPLIWATYMEGNRSCKEEIIWRRILSFKRYIPNKNYNTISESWLRNKNLSAMHLPIPKRKFSYGKSIGMRITNFFCLPQGRSVWGVLANTRYSFLHN